MSIAEIIDAVADAGAREGAPSKTVEFDLVALDVSASGDAIAPWPHWPIGPYIATVIDISRATKDAKERVGAQEATLTINFVQKKATITFKY